MARTVLRAFVGASVAGRGTFVRAPCYEFRRAWSGSQGDLTAAFALCYTPGASNVVPVAQWLERLTVDQEVVGSRPIRHPTPTSEMLACHWQVFFVRRGFRPPAPLPPCPPPTASSCSREVTLLFAPPDTPAEVTPAICEESLFIRAATSFSTRSTRHGIAEASTQPMLRPRSTGARAGWVRAART